MAVLSGPHWPGAGRERQGSPVSGAQEFQRSSVRQSLCPMLLIGSSWEIELISPWRKPPLLCTVWQEHEDERSCFSPDLANHNEVTGVLFHHLDPPLLASAARAADRLQQNRPPYRRRFPIVILFRHVSKAMARNRQSHNSSNRIPPRCSPCFQECREPFVASIASIASIVSTASTTARCCPCESTSNSPTHVYVD